MAIEFSGVLHSAYLIQYFAAWCAGKTIKSNEPPRSVFQTIFFYGRALMSVGLVVYAFYVTLYALFNGKTTMWEGVPPWASVILFALLFSIKDIQLGSDLVT